MYMDDIVRKVNIGINKGEEMIGQRENVWRVNLLL